MSDQCKHCIVRGDYGKCINTECSKHESWIDKVRIERIRLLELALSETHNTRPDWWVSVKERLPDPVDDDEFYGKRYSVPTIGLNIVTGQVYGLTVLWDYQKQGWVESSLWNGTDPDDYELPVFTHWMSLPTAPTPEINPADCLRGFGDGPHFGGFKAAKTEVDRLKEARKIDPADLNKPMDI